MLIHLSLSLALTLTLLNFQLPDTDGLISILLKINQELIILLFM